MFLLLCLVINVVVAGGTISVQDSGTNDANHYNFDALTKLLKRLDVLESDAPDTLLGFYEPRLKSFSVKPEPGKVERVCITSTCYALLTLTLSSGGVYDSIVGSNKEDLDKVDPTKIPIRQVLKTLLKSKWREDDLFQVPLLMYTLLRVDTDRSIIRSAAQDPEVACKIQTLISVVLKACPDPRMGTRQVYSDYITYQVCKVLALLQETTELPKPLLSKLHQSEYSDAHTIVEADKGVGGLPLNTLPDELPSEIFIALLNCAEVSSNELCRQLALRTAGDRNSFDVIRLAYSLLTYIRSTNSLSGIAGREIEPGSGPSPDTKVTPLNKKLVAAALAAFFDEQNSEGLWVKGQPIYKSFRRQGRNMGNAFVFSVNTVGSLLCQLPAEDFRPHLNALEKTLSWIESHQSVEVITDFCDPISGQCYGRPLRGWASPHNPDCGPQAWSTAQVLKCASWMRKTIRQLMHNDVIEEFSGIRFSDKGMRTENWDRLLDSDLGSPDEEGVRTLKSVLEERVITPFSSSMDNPSYGAAYSAVLFGPPGTAKTTICEALAERMGFDFCVIDTASFLADGLSNVAARIRYVFRRLMALNSSIILFDEIEEFALDRETPGISMESRMLTTAMLTAINDLRSTKQSIFFIATNRLRAFDSAITRRGRFDMQLFVGTPNLESRIRQFQEKLAGIGVEDDEINKDEAIESYRDFLESEWSKDAMYMNYLEGMQFASACANIIASNRKLSKKEMSSILAEQARVMTVRRSSRTEYIETMGLSRL
jgi:hypothetical protein